MADFGSPVVNADTAYTPMKGVQTLSGLIGLKQQQQSLQTGQYTQESAKAKASIDTQSASENQAVAQAIKDPVGSGFIDSEGMPTKDGLKKFMQIAPTTGADRYDKFISASKTGLDFKSGLNNLNTQQQQEVGSMFAGAGKGANSFSEIEASANQMKESKKGTPFEDNYNKLIDSGLHLISQGGDWKGDPDKVPWANQQHMALLAGQRILGAQSVVGAGGIATPNIGTQFNGQGQLQGTTQDKLTGAINPAGQGVNVGISPESRAAPVSLPNSQVGVLDRSTGKYILARPAGGNASQAPQVPGAIRTAADDAPGSNAPETVRKNYEIATQKANEHTESVRVADEGYGNNKAISSAVRRLASDSATGPGTDTWNHAMGILGTNSGNNVQELGAFLDRQAATVRGQMGLPGTNAGAEDAKMIAGNTKYNSKVIQDKNDYTEALTDGLHQYRNGLDRVAGFGGQASPNQIGKFKSAWTNSFDPNVFIGENAYKRSKADGDAFMATLKPEEANSLRSKRKALQDLAAGRMP